MAGSRRGSRARYCRIDFLFFILVLAAPETVQAIARCLERGAEFFPEAVTTARRVLRAVLVAALTAALGVRVVLGNALCEATVAMRTVVEHLARDSDLLAANAAHKTASVKALPAPADLHRIDMLEL
jgi:hypothetical protein